MRAIKLFFAALCASLALAVTPAAATQLYTSDNSSTGFDATTVASLPTGWTNVVGTHWSTGTFNPLTGHTHTLTNNNSTFGDISINNGVTSSADMDVIFAQKMVSLYTTGADSAGAVCRSDSAGNNNYTAILSNNSGSLGAAIFKRTSGSYSLLNVTNATNVTTYSIGDILILRFECLGTTIRIKVWKSTSQEPTAWDNSLTDGSVTAAGYGGVYGSNATSISVSDFAVDSINATTSFINRSNTVTASGGSITISGTYTGTAPASINANVDGGSYGALGSQTISGGTFSGTLTTPADGYHNIDVQNAGATGTTGIGIYNSSGFTPPAASKGLLFHSVP